MIYDNCEPTLRILRAGLLFKSLGRYQTLARHLKNVYKARNWNSAFYPQKESIAAGQTFSAAVATSGWLNGLT